MTRKIDLNVYEHEGAYYIGEDSGNGRISLHAKLVTEDVDRISLVERPDGYHPRRIDLYDGTYLELNEGVDENYLVAYKKSETEAQMDTVQFTVRVDWNEAKPLVYRANAAKSRKTAGYFTGGIVTNTSWNGTGNWQ